MFKSMFKEAAAIYEYREMLKNSVKKELRARYKGSVIGFFWTFLNPLLMLVVYTIVFSSVMRVEVPGYPFALFLFVGLVPWLFFATAVQNSTGLIIGQANLIRKIYFPRIILPLAMTLTNLVNMLFAFVIVFIAIAIFHPQIGLSILFLPVVILIETLFVFGVSLILSGVTVFLRDLEHVMGILIMAWFYLTPVVYPASYIPGRYLNYFKLNPLFPLINAYREILLFNKTPDIQGLIYVSGLTLVLLTIGYALFNQLQKRFAEEI